MSIPTILLFFIYCYGLGFSITKFMKSSENSLERHLMRIGIGLGALPPVIVIMNQLHIPLDWRIVLLISLVIPVYSVIKEKSYKNIKLPQLKLTKENINILAVLAIFLVVLFMYEKGTFAYPYFEDEDPWGQSADAAYMSAAKTANEPIPGTDVLSFAVPKPPAYDALMGILHQTSSHLMWTVKFFNSLIASLGVIFFYFFTKELIGSRNKALFATFVFASLPCYLSHFVWSHALVVTLFIPAFYAAEKTRQDKRWGIALAVMTAGVLLVQPTQAIKFVIMIGGYWIIRSIYERKINKVVAIALIAGFIISLVWWAPYGKSMFNDQSAGVEYYHGLVSHTLWERIKNAFPPESGSATRAYSVGDFFIAKSRNTINNPVGLGLFACSLLVLAVIITALNFKTLRQKENYWIAVALFWLLFTFLGINSMTFHLPVGLFAFRFWMLFAMPASLLIPTAVWMLTGLAGKFPLGKIAVLAVIIIGIVITSFYPKYLINTSPGWYSGQWGQGELEGYVWMKENLPVNTPVFTFADATRIVSMDKYNCFWCKDEIAFRESAFNKTTDEIHAFIKSKGYEYTAISTIDIEKYGINKTNEKLQEFLKSDKFSLVYPPGQITGIAVFRVK